MVLKLLHVLDQLEAWENPVGPSLPPPAGGSHLAGLWQELTTHSANKLPDAATSPLFRALLPPNRNIKHLAHTMVLNAGQLLCLSTYFYNSAGDLSRGTKGIPWQHGAGCCSLNQAPMRGNKESDSHHWHLPSYQLASLGLSFLICQMGVITFVGNTFHAQIA